MKINKFPTDDAEDNREIMRRIYERETRNSDARSLSVILAVAIASIAAISIAINLIFKSL